MTIANTAAPVTAILKTKYQKKKIDDLSYKECRAWAMLPKTTDFGGDFKAIALKYGTPRGRSVDFATAQKNRTPSSFARFLLTRARSYSSAAIGTEGLMATRGDQNALISLVTSEVDGALRSNVHSLSWDIYRDGSGRRGRLSASSNPATTSVVLENPYDTVGLEKGDTIVFSASSDGTAIKVGTAQVLTVNRMTGALSFCAPGGSSAVALNTLVPTIAAHDYLYVEGDAGLTISGFQSWGPSVVTSAPFFSLDRTTDTRLAMLYADYTNANIVEALIDAAAQIDVQGGAADTVYMHTIQYALLARSLETKRVIDVKTDNPNVGFRAIELETPNGVLKIVSDRWCPYGEFFMLTQDSWEFASLGDAPMILDPDGLQMVRMPGQDAIEVRTGFFGNLGCYSPVWNLRGVLASNVINS